MNWNLIFKFTKLYLKFYEISKSKIFVFSIFFLKNTCFVKKILTNYISEILKKLINNNNSYYFYLYKN